MKKIIMITGSLPPIACGVGYYSAKLLTKLKDPQLNITVISTKGVNPIDFPTLTTPDWKIRRIPRLINDLKKNQGDVVHIQYPAVGYGREFGINLLPYMIRLRLPRTELIVTLHEYSASRLIGRIRDFITVLPANKIIVSNESDRNAFPGFLRKRTTIIPISSDIPVVKFDPKYYQQLLSKGDLDVNKPTLAFFGYPHRTKQLEILLNAMKNEALSDFQLLLLTSLRVDDDYESILIDIINELNQNWARVYWTGFLDEKDVSVLLQGSKYFVLPQDSPINGKSGTAIAAISHGLVLIAMAPENAKDSLPYVHKENSYLVSPMSETSLIKAIQDLSSNPKLEKSIVLGTKKLAKYFSWDNIARRHKDIYFDGH